ncbi:transcriptional regulator, TetR family [Blastococcus aurantiacus]|uniref:Transcriptional regulator, TetR family n=1 Tax=Blastococcus aurantiacus TaxID=1550231 RepID=A0A1G7NS82_9ACTN|nr:TetR family transcriptional regulator [Blastococcus aurantiacus]SDF76787.1 transcriptional regulator, TetR family [Blastococcus aurantiacus]
MTTTMDGDRSGVPPLTKGERTRRRIMDSALELFGERGYTSVSLRDVAARAAITHAGLLHYFSGKDDLLITVMIDRDKQEIIALQEHIEQLSRRDGRPWTVDDVGLSWLVGQIAANQRRPDLAPLYVKLSAEATEPSHPAHNYFRKRYARLRRTLTGSMARAFATADPPVTGHDPVAAAAQVIALADGLQIQWVLDPDSVDMVASLLGYLRMLGIDPDGWALADEAAG